MAICSNNCIHYVLCVSQDKLNNKYCAAYKGHCHECDNAEKRIISDEEYYYCKLGHGVHSGRFFCLTWSEVKNGNKKEG